MSLSQRTAIRGDLLDFVKAPVRADIGSPAVRFRAGHWLLIDNGVISGATADAPDATWNRVDHRGKLILPGFIDTHVHSPQLDVIGSWGAQLLDWLDTYTFPAERRQADPMQAAGTAALFLDALLANVVGFKEAFIQHSARSGMNDPVAVLLTIGMVEVWRSDPSAWDWAR